MAATSTSTRVAGRIGIEGMDSLLAVVKGLPEEIRTDVVVDIVRAGGKVVKTGAKFLAPVKEGNLRDSIDQVEVRYPANYSAISVVGPRRRFPGLPTKYASQVEFGHIIGTRGIRKGKATKNFIGPKPGYAGYVPGKPYMRPAVQTAATFALPPMYEAAERGLEKAANKLVRKYGHKRSN